MDQQLLLFMHIISVTVSVIFLWATVKRTEVGRLLLACLFLWAAYINAKTAITNPQDYLNYASYAWLDLYRDFILGWFAMHIKPMVLMIACGQLFIAIGLSTSGMLVKWAARAAIIFLIAIIPLGIGAGFPTSLILAVAAYLISLVNDHRTFWHIAQGIWRKAKS